MIYNVVYTKIVIKSSKSHLKEYWRYRIGNYRIIADIDHHEIKIIIFNTGHRKDIYS